MKDPLTQRLLFLCGLLVAAFIAGSLLSSHFLQASTVGYLLQYVPVLGVLGMAQTLVMLSGGPGIDLSIGATMSLVGLPPEMAAPLLEMGFQQRRNGVGLTASGTL